MIAVIDYGMGNLLSVTKALEHMGGNPVKITSPDELDRASAFVLPGVGNFGDGMKNLNESGFSPAIIKAVEKGKPMLGICLGMQLLLENSEEAPGIKGLGIFKGSVIRFRDKSLKVPHMGWNQVRINQACKNFKDVPDDSYFYFVHSYYAQPDDASIVCGVTSYGVDFASAIGREGIFATQFHPEKSQDAGLKILENFVKSANSSN